MFEERVLFVDDDENILESFQRNLCDHVHVATAVGGEQGLKMIGEKDPFAVIVSDLRMPKMDGVEFLTHAKDRSPNSSRMLLSGNVDLETAIQVVNEGQIFRLLTKPCAPDVLLGSVESAIKQYRLVMAEKELLQSTFRGTVKVLTDILSMADPESFERTVLMREGVRKTAEALNVEKVWEVELAWMLSQIGVVTIPPEILLKKRSGQQITKQEEEISSRAPEIASQLLGNIPRLEFITEIIAYHGKRYDGTGYPKDLVKENDIPLGARILKVISDLSELEMKEMPRSDALKRMKNRGGWYDQAVLKAVTRVFDGIDQAEVSSEPSLALTIREIRIGDKLLGDVKTDDGRLLVPAGTLITALQLVRIKNFHRAAGVREPIQVERLSHENERRP